LIQPAGAKLFCEDWFILSKKINGQNTLFDVGCSMFDVRRSFVSFLIYLVAFRASGQADPPPAEHPKPVNCVFA
jgi:hypothetical protein